MQTYKIKTTPYMKNKHTEIIKNNPADKVYTPPEIAKKIIEDIDKRFSIKGKVLEPFLGGGAFYNNFPKHCEKYWCEIDKGRDLLEYQDKVDWIITNPPYSCFDYMLMHSFELADNIVFFIPINKLTSSHRRIMDILKYGGVRYIKIYKGKDAGFKFGFATGAVYMQRGYKGNVEVCV